MPQLIRDIRYIYCSSATPSSIQAYEHELLGHWNEQQVVVELPASNRYHLGEAQLSERAYLRGRPLQVATSREERVP